MLVCSFGNIKNKAKKSVELVAVYLPVRAWKSSIWYW